MANININAGDSSQKALRNSDPFHKQADHRYVNFADGDDNNNGSVYRPWKTLPHALINTQDNHDIVMSGNETGASVAIGNKNGIRISGEYGSSFTGNLSLSNSSDIVIDLEVAGELTFTNCSNITISRADSLTLLRGFSHNNGLTIYGRCTCPIILDTAGTNTDVYINDNYGGAGTVTFANGATGNVTVKNSVCAGVVNNGTAGAMSVRLENAYTTTGAITPTTGSMTVSHWVNSDITAGSPTNSSTLVTSQAVIDYVAEQTASSPEVVQHLCPSGSNSILMLTNKGVYSASGNGASITSMTGRGAADDQPELYGVDAINKVVFVGKENVDIIDCITNQSVSMVLFADGELWGWGKNHNGQLGLGDTATRNLPVLLKTNVSKIWTNETVSNYSRLDGSHFIQDNDGWIWGAGRNSNGQMGFGGTGIQSTWLRLDWIGQNPLAVWSIGTTYGFMFVQKADSTLWASGTNSSGQLGIGNTTNQPTGIEVSDDWFGVGNIFPVLEVTGGAGYFSTAASSDGSSYVLYDDGANKQLKASGDNSRGQLNQGNTTNTNVPVTLTFGVTTNDVVQLSVVGGGAPSCSALLSDGSLWTWGYNGSGQCGTGNTVNVTTAVNPINNIAEILRPNFSSQTNSFRSSIFLKDTSGYCWAGGENSSGQLGLGDFSDQLTFQRVLLSSPIAHVGQFCTSGNGAQSCTVFTTVDNEMYACGYGGNYGVTRRVSNNISSPIRVFYK